MMDDKAPAASDVAHSKADAIFKRMQERDSSRKSEAERAKNIAGYTSRSRIHGQYIWWRAVRHYPTILTLLARSLTASPAH